MKRLFQNFGYKLLALGVAFLLWGVAHSTDSVERGFDVPISEERVPDALVVTGRSHDAVNIRVRGTRAALRRLSVGEIEYPVDLSGAKEGTANVEVDTTALQMPPGAQIVSRSPSALDIALERRGTRAVRIRPDLEGEPANGYQVARVDVDPPQVRITGARSEVLRLSEVLTETIDVTGAQSSIERKVRPSLPGRHVWLEREQEITVRVQVEPRAESEEETG